MTWLLIGSDAVIASTALLISAALVWSDLKRKRPLASAAAPGLIAVLIAMLGFGHLLECLAVSQSIDVLRSFEKAATAVVSVFAAITIIPLLPKWLALRSPDDLAEADQLLREEAAGRTLAEEDLRRALADSHRAALELEQFAQVASQDLQAPLRAVSGFSQLLVHRHRAALDGDALEFLDYVDKGTRQMQALVRDLLILSRIGRTVTGNFERQSLSIALTRAIRSLQEPIGRSGAEIVFGVLPEIQGDHALLSQLLQNLIGNAIKFCKPGQKPRVTISIERKEEVWELIVADNGIGIPEAQLESVFTIFRRLHACDEYEGTGIGLAICRKIANFHDGEITANADARGTQFHIRLPVSLPVRRHAMLTDDEAVRLRA